MTLVRTQRSYFGYEQNIGLSNGAIELVLATEFGPRVMFLGRPSGPNVFAEISPHAQSNPTPYGDDWHIYGGHRLWYAPEHPEHSYYPDNAPVRVEPTARGARLTQAPESDTGIEKSIEVTLAEADAHVVVQHTLRNCGQQTRELAPWALSAMAQGGRAIFAHSRFRPHPDALAPARPLVLWPFTRMNDSRFTWGDRYFFLRQDASATAPQKIGFYDDRGYLAYALGSQLFVKCHTPRPGLHADLGCNAEAFTNELFLELETLGPLTKLAPGQQVEHVEHWFLFQDVQLGDSERDIERALSPLLARVGAVFALPA